MKPSIPFVMALVLLLGGVAMHRSADVQYYRSIDIEQGEESPQSAQWVEALYGGDAPLVRNPYAYAPASCGFTGRDAGQGQRASELARLLEEESRPAFPFESSRRWCDAGCAPRDNSSVLWQETPGDPYEEGCWVWVEYYSRSLINQTVWPFCACEYDWSLHARTCAVTSDTLTETQSRRSGTVAEAFPDTALQDAVWASGW